MRGEREAERGFLNILWGIYESCKQNAKAEKSLENEAEQVRLRLLQVSLITGKVAHFKSASVSLFLSPSPSQSCLPPASLSPTVATFQSHGDKFLKLIKMPSTYVEALRPRAMRRVYLWIGPKRWRGRGGLTVGAAIYA